MRCTIVLLRSLFTFFFLIGIGSFAVWAEESTVTIGALFPLTGEFASQGAAFLEGAQIAIAEANNRPSTITYKLHAEDTQYLSSPTIAATHKLIRNKSLIGMVISTLHEARPVIPLLKNAKIPGVILWDAGVEIDASGEWIFGIGPDTQLSGTSAASFAQTRLHAHRAATINTMDVWSQSVTESFKKSFLAQHGEIVFSAEMQPTDADFRSVLTRLKSYNPEVIYAPIDNNIPSFFEQLKTLNVTIPVITSDIITNNLLSGAPAIYEGVYQIQPHLFEGSSFKYVRQRCALSCNQMLFVGWGYDGVRTLIEAHTNTPSSIIAGMSKVDFSGVTTNIKFGNSHSSPSRLAAYVVKQGELIEVP